MNSASPTTSVHTLGEAEHGHPTQADLLVVKVNEKTPIPPLAAIYPNDKGPNCHHLERHQTVETVPFSEHYIVPQT